MLGIGELTVKRDVGLLEADPHVVELLGRGLFQRVVLAVSRIQAQPPAQRVQIEAAGLGD